MWYCEKDRRYGGRRKFAKTDGDIVLERVRGDRRRERGRVPERRGEKGRCVRRGDLGGRNVEKQFRRSILSTHS